MDINNLVLINRNFLAQIINSLTTLDVRGWDSINTLVGCVNALNDVANQEPVKIEPIKPEEGVQQDDNNNENREDV